MTRDLTKTGILFVIVMTTQTGFSQNAGSKAFTITGAIQENTIDGTETFPTAKRVNGVMIQNTAKPLPNSGSSYTITIYKMSGAVLCSDTKTFPNSSALTTNSFNLAVNGNITAKYLTDSCTTTISCKLKPGFTKTIGAGYQFAAKSTDGKINLSTHQTAMTYFSPSEAEVSNIVWK